MSQRPGCTLCLHACDERWVGDGIRAFCSTCLAALGRFATSSPARTRLWPALKGIVNAPAAEEIVRQAIDHDEAPRWEPGTTPRRLAAAEQHLVQAEVYARRGLPGHALREAAAALQDERHLPPQHAVKALAILLNPRHLAVDPDELMIVLREKLFVH